MGNFALQTIFLAFILLTTVAGADVAYMKKAIEAHFSDVRHHTAAKGQYKEDAMTFIYEEFKRFGLETEYQNVTDKSLPAGITFTNVVGVLKGDNFKAANDKIVGMCANYDTIAETKGVDDNGSGVAAMLEVARQLTRMNKIGIRRKNTIVFGAFDAEEYDYFGSTSFIKQWVNPWLVKNYGYEIAKKIRPHGVIVVDSLMNFNMSENSQLIPGTNETIFMEYFPKAYSNMKMNNFKGNFLSVVYRKPTTDVVLAAALNSSTERNRELEFFPIPAIKISQLNSTTQSDLSYTVQGDHVHLWEDNIPAVLISDTGKYRGNMVNCYQKGCDDLNTMLTDDNIDFLGRTADTIAKAIHHLSDHYGNEMSSAGSVQAKILYPAAAVLVGYLKHALQ